MDNKEPDEKVIIKYSSYTPAQKRATQKYRQNNKEKVNEQRKKYYQLRKEKDPQFLEYKRLKAKEYYQKRKELKAEEPVLMEEPIIPEVVEQVIEPDIQEIIPEPVKVKRVRKQKKEKEEIKSDSISDKTELGQIITQAIEEVKEEKKKTKKAKKSKEV
jgi:hypothetical protein